MVPRSLVDEVLYLCHDLPLSGHSCARLTLEKLRARFFCPQMSKDCALYVESCSACNQSKRSGRKARAGLGTYHAGAPLERVHLDILGPFPRSLTGNCYVLMLIDQFTKWLECFPLPNQSSETVAKTLVDGFLSRFGCPSEIHTDQGKNMDGVLMRQLCELLQITKTRTTPYHPASNGQVERYYRSVLQAIRCYLKNKQSDWDLHLQQIAGAIRATEN